MKGGLCISLSKLWFIANHEPNSYPSNDPSLELSIHSFYCRNLFSPLHLNHSLQLRAAARLEHLVVLGVRDALLALPPEGVEALRQVRVGEVVVCVHPVGVHAAEVLDVQLEEGGRELEAHAEVAGEGVGLELELAGDDVHEELDDGVHGGEGVGEEEEPDDDGALRGETKGGVEGAIVDEDGEEAEDVE
jgi:hypothetical protein